MGARSLDFHQRLLFILVTCGSLVCLAPRISTSDTAERQCPCKVCPCYCPCVDRSALRVGFVHDYDDSLFMEDALTRTDFALAKGVRQAARDRGLQLHSYTPCKAADLRRFHMDLFGGLLDVVVVMLGCKTYIPSLVAAVQKGIPVYIVGSAPRSLLHGLRVPTPANQPNGQVPATPLAGLVHVGSVVEDVMAVAAQRLVSAGMQRLHCINTHEDNVVSQEICRLLVQEFASRGLVGASHITNPLFATMAFTLSDISTAFATQGSWAAGNGTALVVMDTVAYTLVNSARDVRGLLPEAHVLVWETSVGVLADMRAGKAVTAVDQPHYSEGYMAVALAAQELVTGQMLTGDLQSMARLMSVAEVTDYDLARVVCREEGFPVWGDPGVANVTVSGCTCFQRSDVKFRVLATLPTVEELRREVIAGLLDAYRDFPGSSFMWSMGQDADFNGRFPSMVANTALSQDNWTSLLSLDLHLVPVDASLDFAMVRIGQVKGNRSCWLGVMRDESVPTGAFLARYSADGYIGPTPQGWASLGRVARDGLGGAPAPSVLLYSPLLHLPLWAQVSHNFVDGYFNGSLNVPSDFWKWPVQGDPVAGTGVWSLFCNGWAAPAAFDGNASVQGSPKLAEQCHPLEQATLQIKPAPPALTVRTPFVQGLTALVQENGRAYNVGSYDAVGIASFLAEDALLALQVLEDTNATAHGGAKTTLFSMGCYSNDFQAFAYPDSMSGGGRHAGCLDPQLQLATYIAYTAAVLHQQTLGEKLLSLEVPTQRIVTREGFNRAQQRAADCRIARRQGQEVETMFPVCDYRAGCGGHDTAPPCSGHGTCRFPTAEMNAAAAGTLTPWLGQCACNKGYKGRLCEAKDSSHVGLKVGLPIALALLLLLLPMVVCTRLRTRWFLRAKHGVRKMRRPAEGQQVAIVFTDIEGSTMLWEWNPEVMVQALQIHYRLLRALLPKHHGYESNTEGDAFELVFHNANDALHWVMDAQLALLYPEKVLEHGKFWAHLSYSSSTSAWPPELLNHPLGAEVRGKDGSVLYRGLRVRMGMHVGVPEASFQHPNGRQRYIGRVATLAKAIGDAPDQGGQVLMSMDAWASLDMASGHMPLVAYSMGDHVLGKDLPPLGIMQVLPQSLQSRVPFRALRSHEQLSPSFFEAPASDSYLEGVAPRDPVAIVFTFVCGDKAFKRSSGFPAGVRLLTTFVRATLHDHRGYECEEKFGNFLLAFGDPLDAVMFSQDLQMGAMALPWAHELLLEQGAAEVVSPKASRQRSASSVLALDLAQSMQADTQLVFRGLRIKTGICWSKPVRCLPHGSTGRAAYFGPLMNRAARIASSAAEGETLCNAELVQAVCAMEGAQHADITFTSLGDFSLKGVSNVMELFQVSNSRLAARHLPLRTPSKRRHSVSSGPGPGPARQLSSDSILWSPSKTRQLLTRTSFESTSSSDHNSDISPAGTRALEQVQETQENLLASFQAVDPIKGGWRDHETTGVSKHEPANRFPRMDARAGAGPQRNPPRLSLDSIMLVLDRPLRRLVGGAKKEASHVVPEHQGLNARPSVMIPDEPSSDAWVCPEFLRVHLESPAGEDRSNSPSWGRRRTLGDMELMTP